MDDELRAKAIRLVEEALTSPDPAAAVEAVAQNDPQLRRAALDHFQEVMRVAKSLDSEEAWSDAETAGDPAPKIPGYRLLGRVGSGGMGAVYRALREHEGFEQEVAVKLLHTGLAEGESRARFEQEPRILAGLHHHSLARLIDGGSTSGRPYLVTEFIDGIHLDRFCKANALSPEELVSLFLGNLFRRGLSTPAGGRSSRS